MTSHYIAEIAALYEERRRIWAEGCALRGDRDRLSAIATETALLWRQERARRAGADPDLLPGVLVVDSRGWGLAPWKESRW